jgi:hypothetical protein
VSDLRAFPIPSLSTIEKVQNLHLKLISFSESLL